MAKPSRFRKLGVSSAQYDRILDSVRKKLVYRMVNEPVVCEYCKCFLCKNTLTLDHKVPVTSENVFDKDNIVPSCWECNHEKADAHEYEPNEFRMYPRFSKKGERLMLGKRGKVKLPSNPYWHIYCKSLLVHECLQNWFQDDWHRFCPVWALA